MKTSKQLWLAVATGIAIGVYRSSGVDLRVAKDLQRFSLCVDTAPVAP